MAGAMCGSDLKGTNKSTLLYCLMGWFTLFCYLAQTYSSVTSTENGDLFRESSNFMLSYIYIYIYIYI